MRNKIISLSVFIVIIIAIGCLILSLKSKKVVQETYFTDEIQELVILDGTSGNKIIIENKEELTSVYDIIRNTAFVNITDSVEDTSGYKWHITIKTKNGNLDIIGPNNVRYGNKIFKYLNSSDYSRMEKYISELYNESAN